MIVIERFDTVRPTSGDGLSAILQRSKDRAKRKYDEVSLQPCSTPAPRTINIQKLMETQEEKKARKALAKILKRERKQALISIDVDTVDHTTVPLEEEEDAYDHDVLEEPIPMQKFVKTESPDTLDTEESQNKEDSIRKKDRASKSIEVVSQPLAPLSSTTPTSTVVTSSGVNAPWIPQAFILRERMTVQQSCLTWGVRGELAEALSKDGVVDFFPVQIAVIPILLRQSLHQPFAPSRDIIVSAPTGSGKTLAYALPIVQSLLDHTSPTPTIDQRDRRRLQALIILPSRELVSQVIYLFFYPLKKTFFFQVISIL
jgi:hypothetical protein